MASAAPAHGAGSQFGLGRKRSEDESGGPLRAARSCATVLRVSQTVVLLWILALFILEVQHLKWIWWEYWSCRSCSEKHKDCACGATRAWVMFL